MSRKKTIGGRDQLSGATEADYKRFAERFVDLMLDPDKYWLLQYFIHGGFTYSAHSLAELALDIIAAPDRLYLMPKDIFDAAIDGNREKLIAYVMSDLQETRPSVENLFRTLKALSASELRRSVEEAAGIFKLRRGPNPKIPVHKYPELAVRAAQLTPVIYKLLAELEQGTKKSLRDLLEFWKEDHPEACSFLLPYLGRLQQALNDQGLIKRGAKIKSRARVLADALAGSDYGLTFRTSLDRVRSARKAPSLVS